MGRKPVDDTNYPIDDILGDYLKTADDHEAEKLENDLIEHAKSVIETNLYNKFAENPSLSSISSAEDIEEVLFGITLNFLMALRKKRQSLLENLGDTKPIRKFTPYLKTVAENGFNMYVRKRNPRWYRLSMNLRQTIKKFYLLDLWVIEGSTGKSKSTETLCGLEKWKGERRVSSDNYQWWIIDVKKFEDTLESDFELSVKNLPELLPIVFEWVNGPMAINVLVTGLFKLLRLSEDTATNYGPLQPIDDGKIEDVPDPDTLKRHIDANLKKSEEFLRDSWKEIKQLQVEQRVSLLLGKKGRKQILEPLLRLVSQFEMSVVLEIKREELIDYLQRDKVECDKEPLDDKEIGSILDLTQQQVIDRRKKAIERLRRRLKGWG